MKIYTAFLPKGNMVNRQYRANKNARNFVLGTGICQNMIEIVNAVVGKPINTANIALWSGNVLLGIVIKSAGTNLQGEYLKIIERAKNIKFIKSIIQRYYFIKLL